MKTSDTNKEEESDKIHGDKLEQPSKKPEVNVPPHSNPQTDGGDKVHGEKLEL